MKIFVTGCAGFLGSWVAEHYVKEGHRVFGCDTLIGGELSNVPADVTFYPIDILETERLADVFRKEKIDLVYHTAALAYEGLSVFSPALITRNIFAGSTSVHSAVISSGVDYLVQCSSMARYGELTPPFSEDMICNPVDPYGLAKLSADQCLAMLSKTHGLTYTVAVPHNIIGQRQKYDDPYRNVASIMINRMLQGKQPVIYGDGGQTRCFSFVQDVLACLTAIPFVREAEGEVINVGPDESPTSVLELSHVIAKLIGFKLDPIFMPGRPCEVKHAECSSDKARRILNYKTAWTLEEGLMSMIEHIASIGPKPFTYHLPLEISSRLTPKTWSERLF